MNTTAKGDQLEEEVFELIQTLIDTGRFLVPKEHGRLRKKPKYYSRDREKEIVFDLSVEFWFQGALRASLIFLIECKNYSHLVPVDDVEEFYSKCQQVEAHKGIIVSRSGFQLGGQMFAKNKRMGLMRYLGNSDHKWVLERSTAANITLASAEERILLSDLVRGNGFAPPVIDVVCDTVNGATISLWEFFDDLLGDHGYAEWSEIQNPIVEFSAVPYREADEIETLAAEIAAMEGLTVGPTNLDLICCNENHINGLEVVRYKPGLPVGAKHDILGRFRLKERVIEIFEGHMKNEAQLRFTLAHELGHHFLRHSKYLVLDTFDEGDLEDLRQPLLRITDVARLEWQANRFASSLLMPRRSFLHRFHDLIKQMNINDHGYGLLYVDDQPCNQESFETICWNLSRFFGVSFGAIAVRLNVLGLLNDQRRSTTGAVNRLLE